MNRIWIVAVAMVLICGGCRVTRNGDGWSFGFLPAAEILGDLVWNGNDDYDNSRRFYDQTSDNPRR